MYNLINRHIILICQSINDNHVTEYDWLVENIENVANNEYRGLFKKYWRPRFSNDFANQYFERLQNGLLHGPPQIGVLTQELYIISTYANGRQSLQFSLCSKLCHMLNRQIPIYDSMIRDFYFFTAPTSTLPIDQRIAALVQFHQFLSNEYGRVLHEGLLTPSIHAFRQHFNPQWFTGVKVIDSLIWAFISLLKTDQNFRKICGLWS